MVINLALPAGTPVYISGNVSHGGQMKTTVERYNPSSLTHNPDSPILGLIQTGISALSDGVAVVSGVLQMNTTNIGTPGTKVYIDGSGQLVGGRPSSGPARYVAVVAVQGTQGLIVVQTKGNGTWGALKDARVPLLLEDWEVAMDIYRPVTDAVILSLSPEPIEFQDEEGSFTVTLTSAQSQLLETGDIFDIQLTELLSEGRVWTVARGSMVILEDVTQ
jgi:hypothetical protein